MEHKADLLRSLGVSDPRLEIRLSSSWYKGDSSERLLGRKGEPSFS